MAWRLPLGEHVEARKSNHWIMQEEPELVMGAIEKVVKRWQAADDISVATARKLAVPHEIAAQKIAKAAS
jgi:hypothetical protein